MKKISIAATLSLILILACHNQDEQKDFFALKVNYYDSIENQNLKLLNSLNLTRYNDSAKWRLYTYHCDDTTKQEEMYLPISSLNLRLVYVSSQHDTLDLLYQFMKDDSTPINKYSGEKYITDGARFKTSDGKLIGLIRGEATISEKGVTSRYENPLQPEVITYIRSNKDKLNLWFKEEARRKGIIQ